MGHPLGYARVSTVDQDPALQLDALTSAAFAHAAIVVSNDSDLAY